MTDYEFREILNENKRDTIAMWSSYGEHHVPGEEEHEYLGDCVFCKKGIYSDDADYVIHGEEQLGICVRCMSKCHWRCE